eukprot:756352-Hanusia_phi.AAC.1
MTSVHSELVASPIYFDSSVIPRENPTILLKDQSLQSSSEDQSSRLPFAPSTCNLYRMRRWLSSRRHPTKNACLACRSAKTKCDDARPCSRCVNRELVCTGFSTAEGGFAGSDEKPRMIEKASRSRSVKKMKTMKMPSSWAGQANSLLDEALLHVLSEF